MQAATMDSSRIAQRAYELWLADGQPRGQDLEYWLRAEREIQHKATASSQPRTTRRAGRSTMTSTSRNVEWAPW